MQKLYNLILAFLIFSFSHQSFGQTGGYDVTFNAEYKKFGNSVGPDAEVRHIIPLPDGKFAISGWFAYYNGKEVQRIAIINADGSIDQNFNAGRGFNGVVHKIARQPDGKILAVGDYTKFNNDSSYRIVRLNSDGSKDTSFNASANAIIRNVVVQNDGKILISGWFTQVNGQSVNYITRLEPNGNLDTSFINNQVDAYINDMALTSNGKIYIGGGFDTVGNVLSLHIARLNNNGTKDNSFNSSNACNGDVTGLSVQPNGKILLGGWFTFYNGVSRSKICRINEDGSLDLTFNPGLGANSDVNTFLVQPDSKIIIGGFFNTYNGTTQNNIARINADGSLDNSYNTGSAFTSGILNYFVRVSSFALTPDGKLMVGGDFITYNGLNKSCLIRLNNNGSLDVEFNPYNATNGKVNKVVKNTYGSYFLGGEFSAYNNRLQRNNFIKLNEDGTPDDAFGVFLNNKVTDFVVEPSGFITLVGSFTSCNNITASNIVRVSSNGSYDSSFIAYSAFGSNSDVQCIKWLDNGKYLVGGSFNSYNGKSYQNLIQLNFDGTPDTNAFNQNLNINGKVNAIQTQSNGKIIIAGEFTSINGNSFNRIARLNADGTIDFSFTPGNGFNNSVFCLALDSNEHILAGGSFTNFNSILVNGVCKLLPNGILNNAFITGQGANNAVFSIASQSDGKIILGGAFTTFSGFYVSRITRLNFDGTYDYTFSSGGGANNTIRSLFFEPSGKIICGGDFTYLGGNWTRGAGRINGDRLINTGTFSGTLCRQGKINIPYTTIGNFAQGNSFKAEISDANGNFDNAIIIGTGSQTGNGNIVGSIPANLPLGSNYKIRVSSTNPKIAGSTNGSSLVVADCPSIFISSVLENEYCQGYALTVSFEAFGSFNLANNFFVQLSDSSGNFDNPTNLGTINGTGNGSIITNIPNSVVPGENYKVRVASTNPVTYSFDFGKFIRIKQSPTISINNTSATVFCLGDSVKLTGTFSNDVYSKQWFRNNNIIGFGDTTASYYAKVSGNYSLKVTSINGCQVQSNSINVNTFQPNLASINANRYATCLVNNNFTLTDLTSDANKSGRLWQINNQNFTDSIVTTSFPFSGKYQAKLIIYYNNGCIDTTSTQLTVHPQTKVKIAINQVNQCVNNNQFIFTDSSSLETGLYFRQWSLGEQDLYSTKSVTKVYGNIGSYLVKLKTVTDFGCIDSSQNYINVNSNPKADFGYKAIVPCFENNYFQLSDSSSIQNGLISFVQWNIPGYGPSIAPNPGVSLPQEGDNIVKLVAVSALGCTDTITKVINVLPNPAKPYIYYDNGRLNATQASWYQWFLNDVLVADSNKQTFVPQSVGSYRVRVFSSNNCTRLSDPFIINILSIDEPIALGFNMYPNPASGIVTIGLNQKAMIQLHDITGKLIQTIQHNGIETNLNTELLANGVYFVTVSNNTSQSTQKLVISK